MPDLDTPNNDKQDPSKGQQHHILSFLRETLETVVIALVIFSALQFSFQNFRVEGASMEPNFKEGEYLMVNKLVYVSFDPSFLRYILPFLPIKTGNGFHPFHPPERGEVIVFHFPRDPSRDFIKRVMGIPGDEIEIRRGDVFVNGEKIEEPYIQRKDTYSMPRIKVPQGTYFVLGDNRASTNDSRDWGGVPEDKIIGKAWFAYWPTNRWGFIPSNPIGSASAPKN